MLIMVVLRSLLCNEPTSNTFIGHGTPSLHSDGLIDAGYNYMPRMARALNPTPIF